MRTRLLHHFLMCIYDHDPPITATALMIIKSLMCVGVAPNEPRPFTDRVIKKMADF